MDYTATSGTLAFAADETSKTFSVTILANSTGEPQETFTVQLTGATATGTTANITTTTATGTISSDSVPAFWDGNISGNAAGDWGDAANWDSNTLPANNADVTIEDGEAEITTVSRQANTLELLGTTNFYIAGGQSLTLLNGGSTENGTNLNLNSGGLILNAGVFSLAGSMSFINSTISGPGALSISGQASLTSGVISAPITLASGGAINVSTNNLVTLSGVVTVQSGGTITLNSANFSNPVELNITGTVNNAGLVTFGGGGNATLDVTGGTFNNNAGGILRAATSTGSRFLIGTINNNVGGTLEIQNFTNNIAAGSVVTNNGTLSISSGRSLTVQSGGTLIHGATGTLTTTGTSTTLDVNGGATLRLDADLSLPTGMRLLAGNVVGTSGGLANASITQTGTRTLTLNDQVDFRNASIAPNVVISSTGSAAFYSEAQVTFSGTVTVAAGRNFYVSGGASGDETNVIVQGTFNNSGIITLDAPDNGGVTLDATGQVINNLSGGSIVTVNYGSGPATARLTAILTIRAPLPSAPTRSSTLARPGWIT